MGKKKNEPTDGTAKASFGLEPIPQYATMCTSAENSCKLVKKCADYATDKPVQDAVTGVETCVTTLKATLAAIAAARQTLLILEPQLVQDGAGLHRANDTLETVVTNATGGIRSKLIAYGAKIAGPQPSVPSIAPPNKVRGKSKPGTQEAILQCEADSRAICYHYAWGTDPGNPDGWTSGAIEGGATHKVPGLPVGQKLYFRIAIQRRKTGLGAWSDIVEVTIR